MDEKAVVGLRQMTALADELDEVDVRRLGDSSVEATEFAMGWG